MFALQMKKRILKGALFSSIIITFIASVFMVLKKIDSSEVNALTAGQMEVHFSRQWDFVGNPPGDWSVDEANQPKQHTILFSNQDRGHGTLRFYIEHDGLKKTGLCIDPNYIAPDKTDALQPPVVAGINLIAEPMTTAHIDTTQYGSYTKQIPGYTVQDRYDGIKLALYLAIEADKASGGDPAAKAKMNELYGFVNNDLHGNSVADMYIGFSHAVISYLNHGTAVSQETNNTNPPATTGNFATDRQNIERTGKAIMDMVKNDDILWLKAKPYRLYHFDTGQNASLFGAYNSTIYNPELLDAIGVSQDIAWLEDPIYGSITVTGCDAETGGCASLGSSSMKDTTFEIINKSGHPIYYNNKVIENNSQVIVRAITNKDACELPKVSNLPYGTYEVKQIQSGAGYNQTTETETVTIPSNGKVDFTVSLCNQVIRGDVKFKKVDQTGKPMANIAFKITSKTTGENHIVVTNAEGIVDTSLIAHTSNTNAYDSLSSDNYVYHNDYGTWFGKNADGTMVPANDSLGALPYDNYTIEELQCEANGNCYEESQGVHGNFDFTIALNNRTVEFNESWENTCVDFSITTLATDNKDGDKYVLAGQAAEIKDTISYTLMKGQEYTIKGVLMDKETNKPLEIDGKTFENSITVQSDKEKGEATMIFKIPDATSLGGKEIVVFEALYDGDEVIETHENINDAKQTVLFVNLDTTAKDKADGNQSIQPEKDVTIVDSVDYCLLKDQEYILEGTLMDKSTGEPLLIDGAPVIKTLKLKTTNSCDKIEMEFTIDASKLGGTDIVVFERVYLKGKDGDKSTLVVEHTDIKDDAQLIKVLQPEIPDTGFITSSNQGSNSDNPTTIIAIASITIVIVSAAGARIAARKRFLR